MIRIRRSYLEEFRKVLETCYGDEEALVRSIRGQQDPPNEMMQAGTAFHAFLSLSDLDGLGPQVCGEGYLFDRSAVEAGRKYVGPGVMEVHGSVVIEGASIECTADHLHGLVIQDHKCKWTPLDPSDYETAIQWRLYLTVFGASIFRYNFFHFADPRDGYCELKGVESIRFWRYPGMEEDCALLVRRFLGWASDRQLLKDLERDPYQEAA